MCYGVKKYIKSNNKNRSNGKKQTPDCSFYESKSKPIYLYDLHLDKHQICYLRSIHTDLPCLTLASKVNDYRQLTQAYNRDEKEIYNGAELLSQIPCKTTVRLIYWEVLICSDCK